MTVQAVPEHETVGNKVLCPILLPWVLDTDPSNETLTPVTELVKVTAAPYFQSLFVMVKVGRAAPESR